MKRFISLLLALGMVPLLASCGGAENDPNVYEVSYGNKTYTVDQNGQTISVDGYVCQFQLSGGGGSSTVTFTYPDGSTWWHSWSGNSGHGGWSDDYDASRYVSGDTLWSVLEQGGTGGKDSSTHGILGLVLLVLGGLYAAFPRAFWFMSHGWRYKNAEPSELVIGLNRAAGVFAAIVGVICLLV